LLTEIAIVGSGPAGLLASLTLSEAGVPHVLIDHQRFPRDKVCGDAFSGKAVEQLRKVSRLRTAEILREDVVYPVFSMLLVSPRGDAFRLVFRESEQAALNGFTAPRKDYDHVLFELATAAPETTLIEGTRITGYERTPGGHWRLFSGEEAILDTRLVMVADGARSVFTRTVLKRRTAGTSIAVRAYYGGVTFPDRRSIELHFLDDLAPGYFWIFPMSHHRANVGVGLGTRHRKTASPPLRDFFMQKQQSLFAGRFRNAVPEGKPQGWPIPLHTRWWELAGDGYMVLGDAAELVDPFTGEGIGNAMLSGRLAAETAIAAKGNYAQPHLTPYVTALRRHLESEFAVSRFLHRLAARPWWFSQMLRRLSRSPYARRRVSEMLLNVEARKDLINPIFYLRALVGF